jgi:ABC-type hemin transport system ATPase subunit
LTLQEEIVFRAGNVYHLSGPNGSGKSSFIHKVLWEKIIKRDDCYVIRIQQQMDLQLYAMRAWAAIYYPKSRIVDEKDVWDLMWTDLAKMKDGKPWW